GAERRRVLPWAADAALAVGEIAEAQGYAREILGGGSVGSDAHRGHILLGRAALSKKKVKEASEQLLLAGKVDADPVLRSFGPDMKLASDLWDAGARVAVNSYLKECRSLWTSQLPRLDGFIAAAARGEKPNFMTPPSKTPP